jgi:hypothetical protein
MLLLRFKHLINQLKKDYNIPCKGLQIAFINKF